MNEEEKQVSKEVKQPLSYELVSIICTALVVIMIIFTFVFRFVGVVGNSMNPTLNENDWLLVRAINPNGYEYGDIIISTQPNAFHEPIVKRVIATEGQKVHINFKTGDVYVDDVLLQEDYIAERTTTKHDVNFPVIVPEGCVFAMGDNRNDSTDSRSSAIGMIDERYILGKVLFRVLPYNQMEYFR